MDDDIRQQLEQRRYEAALELLLERFKDKVFRLAFSILHNETLAEDAAQEAWVRIWKGLPGYTGAASISTWIYTITRNTCLTELKRRNAHSATSLETLTGGEAAASLAYTTGTPGAGMDVHVFLSALPEQYRRVVTLFYLEQRAYDEVAAMLGLPLGTVKTFLFRAKKELLKMAGRTARVVPLAGPAALQPRATC
jgi:RNA polymerase sigma-70 factor, ECF subfamily